MSVGNLIKNIFVAALLTPLWLLVDMVVAAVFCAIFGIEDGDGWVVITTIFAVITYPLVVWYFYNKDKKKSTCPRCKTPFAYYEKSIGSETLSEDYISQDVKDSDGYYRRKSYKVGKEKKYYEGQCKECGHTTKRSEIGSFKREV